MHIYNSLICNVWAIKAAYNSSIFFRITFVHVAVAVRTVRLYSVHGTSMLLRLLLRVNVQLSSFFHVYSQYINNTVCIL